MRLKDLLEANTPALRSEVEATLPPTMTMPELVNTDPYKQYRYIIALASARAVADRDVEFDAQSAWNEALTAVAYSEIDLETIEMANRLIGVKGVMLSKTASHEPDDTGKVSPVAKFNMSESMRGLMDKLADR
jgi:hypothetical protein